MGKKKKNKNIECVLDDATIAKLSKKEKNVLRQKLDELTTEQRIVCSHSDKHGSPAIDILDNYNCVCRECGAKFNLAKIDYKKAHEAVKTINSMANQIKIFSSNGKEDKGNIEQLGSIVENTRNLAELYERVVNEDGGKKKKKKKKSDSYGSYGSSAIRFDHGNRRDW